MSVDLQSLLLQSLASGGGPALSAADVMGQLDADDPSRAVLATLLLQRQAAQTADEPADEERWPEEGRAEQTAAERRLLRQLEHAVEDVRRLEQRNDSFAAAVGACYVCWGGDPGCEVCGGRGRPGFFAPDPSLFSELAAPALRRLRRRPRSLPPDDVPRAGSADGDRSSTEGGLE